MRDGLMLLLPNNSKSRQNTSRVSCQIFVIRWQKRVISERGEKEQVRHIISIAYFLDKVFGLNYKEGNSSRSQQIQWVKEMEVGLGEVRMAKVNRAKYLRGEIYIEKEPKKYEKHSQHLSARAYEETTQG